MTIKSSGIISVSDINVELGAAAATQRSLNDTNVRTLLGKSSGIISLGDAYGKSNGPVFQYMGSFVAGKYTWGNPTTTFFGWSNGPEVYSVNDQTKGMGTPVNRSLTSNDGTRIDRIFAWHYAGSSDYYLSVFLQKI